MWTLLIALLFAPPALPAHARAPSPGATAPLLAMLRTEPLEQTRRAQDEALLDAPDADVARSLAPDEIATFHAFRKPRWMRAIGDVLLQLLLFLLLIFAGLGNRLHAACAGLQLRLERRRTPAPRSQLAQSLDKLWGAQDWPAAILFAAALAALGSAIFWPTSLVFDWLIPRAHGLSNQSLGRWLQLELIGLATQTLGLTALAFGLWGLMRRVKKIWLWLGVPAGVLVALSGLADPLSVQLRSKLVPLPPGEARAAIEQVLTQAGLSAQEIDRIDARRDTLQLDAFVLGQGPSLRIVLFDTLVDALPPRQLAAVVAHELGHLRDGSRPLRALLAGLSIPLLLALLSRFLGLAARTRRLGFTGAQDVRALPLVLFAAFVLANVASPLSNALSRDRELRADLFALDLTRDPTSLRDALLTLARKNQLDPAPPAAVAALLYDHPALARRLGLIDAWDAMARAGSR